MGATPLSLSLDKVGIGQQWPLAANAALSIHAVADHQFELIGELPPTVRLVKRGNSLVIELDGDRLAVLEGFFERANDRLSTPDNQLFFTTPTSGRLLLASDAARDAADVTVWPNTADAGDDDSAAAWLCVAAAVAAGSALVGSGSGATVDKTPPAVARFNLAEDTGDSDSDLITSRARVDVLLADDAASWEYTLDGGGSWQPGSGSSFLLADNANYDPASVAVRQRDAAGNLSATASNGATIETDSRAPAPPSFSLANDSGRSDSDGITNDATITVNVASDAASWHYRLKGGSWQVGSGSSFELAANSRYAVGEIELRQSDIAGNLSAIGANSTAIVTDTIAPAAPSFALDEDSGSSSSDGVTNNPVVNVSLASDAASWEYRFEDGSWTPGTGSTFELADNTSYGGGGTIQVRQSDAAGNRSTIADNDSRVTVDTLPPAAPSLALAEDSGSSDSDGVTKNPIVNVSLASDAVSWEYRLKGSGWQVGSDSSFELAANTDYTTGEIEVKQNDAAGNSSPVGSNSSAITTDTLAPTAPTFGLAEDTGSSDSDGITKNSTVNVSLASDAASWQYRLKGGSWLAGSDSSFELAANTSYAVGEIELQQVDRAGNPSSIVANTSTITTDSVLPSAATVSPVGLYSAVPAIDVTAQYVSGSASLTTGDRLDVTIGEQLFSDVAVVDGSWQINRSELTELAAGATIEVTAAVVDLAGNQSSDTSSAEITVQRNDIVIFDLTSGRSSFHGVDRSFDAETSYNVFIIVDSDHEMLALASEQQWHGWQHIGADDTIWLVGDNADGNVLAYSGGAVSSSLATGSLLVWASGTDYVTFSQDAVVITASGKLSRLANTTTNTINLFTPTDVDERLVVTGAVGQGYLATISAGAFTNIMTTQGLS